MSQDYVVLDREGFERAVSGMERVSELTSVMGDIPLKEYDQIVRPLLDVIQLLSESVAVELRTSYEKTSLEGWNRGGGL